jgi:hypothetical protein
MRDLHSTKAMWLKGWLFLLVGILSAAILLIENWSWRTAGLWVPITTTTRSQPVSRTVSITRSSRVRPPTLCSILGIGDFIRVPCPAARMTAARAVMAETPESQARWQSWRL